MTTDTRIYPLPLHLANQIAAGEIIERPAFVVKELVENSIDAGASQIDIDIGGAGSKLIRVRDNGCGIHPEDLPLALSRHTTSKLHCSEQLGHINSLGFRGEALPSILSVSQLRLTSRQIDREYGWQLNGVHDAISPVPHPLGTTIEVRDLFFNLPARRRFLRSNKTEQNHILATLYRLSLSSFNIGFSYHISANNRLKLPISTSITSQQQRIAKICGQTFIKNTLYLKQTLGDISLSGWLAKSSAHRPQTDIQYLFINRRMIRDRMINHAVRQAYANQIPAGRHAAYVLYLTLPLDRVDVNVHPTKYEVHFRDARLIHGLITSALNEALSQKDSIDHHDGDREPTGTYIAKRSKLYQTTTRTDKVTRQNPPLAPLKIESLNVLFYQRYLMIDSNHQPLLIDLQRADLYLRKRTLSDAMRTGTLRSHPMLVSISVPAKEESIELYKQHAEVLNHLGIKLIAQPGSLLVKTIPNLLAPVNVQRLVQAIIQALSEDQTSFEQLSHILQQQLLLSALTSLEQANQMLQLLGVEFDDVRWSKRLDQQTLDSLF